MANINLCIFSVSDGDRCNKRYSDKNHCKYHYDSRYNKGKYKQPTAQDIEKMKSLYESGKSSSYVATAVGYSKTTVLRKLRTLGVIRVEEKSQGTKYVYGFDYQPKTKYHKRLLNTARYKEFRKKMFARDEWSCIECGYKGSAIQLDHIKPRSIYPELAFEEDNVRTLCIPCHKLTDTYGIKILHNYIRGNVS